MLEAAFEALNLAGVNWCLARTPSSLSAPTGDVDLLVARAHHARTRRILETLGFGAVGVWVRSEPEAFYFLHHPKTRHNLCLHVATELSFGPNHAIRTTTAAGCLRRRRRRGALVEAHPRDAFWIMLLHCLLDKGDVASRYRADLQRLAVVARADDDLARAAEAICPDWWDAPKLVERVQKGEWKPLNYLAQHLKSATAKGRTLDRVVQLAPMAVGLLSSRSVRQYVWDKGRARIMRQAEKMTTFSANGRDPLARQRTIADGPVDRENRWLAVGAVRKIVGRPLVGGRGLTVALLGPDGVGKSTLAANLAGSLPEFTGVRLLYMGLGHAGLPRLARLPVPGSLAVIGLLTLWWRYLVARYHLMLGRLVVFDRYTYDAWLSPEQRLAGRRRLARWVWAHACPPPDLVFLLDAPGEKVYERRGESAPARLEAARRAFLSLQRRLPQLQVIDASRPREIVKDDVVDRIRRHEQRK